ncbi:peptidase M50 [Halochromatium glycolicum]|uniref:Zinc metalloprotease n=1 Tax=Halochromatium glycolicum TaxID=85075 RepID=A0AAJ0U2S0_9GAMM|nr:peptidase M50 [Halochromatium glycolicum]
MNHQSTNSPNSAQSSLARSRGAGSQGLRIGRIAGIEVTLDWSLLIIFILISFTLAAGVLPTWHPEWSQPIILITAVTAALLFLASVLLHELSHAVVGRRLSISVPRITLFVFGGMAHMEGEPRSWKDELGMAIAGPITSLALGFGFLYLAGALAGPIEADPEKPMDLLSSLGPVATVFFWLGPINIVLGLFNLVPGFPLDGGRVLRAVLWGLSGDLLRATRWAAAAGQAFGLLLIASGFAMVFGLTVPVFGSGPLGGLWLALIGWFLSNAAAMSYRRLATEQGLGRISVSRVMQRDPATVAPETSVQAIIDDHLLGHGQRAFPVVKGNDRLQGLVCLADIRKLEPSKRSETPVSAIMTPVDELQVAAPSESASAVMKRLGERGINQMPVLKDGRLVGLISRENLLTWLSLQQGSAHEAKLSARS